MFLSNQSQVKRHVVFVDICSCASLLAGSVFNVIVVFMIFCTYTTVVMKFRICSKTKF